MVQTYKKLIFLAGMVLISFNLTAADNILSYLEGEVWVVQQGSEFQGDFGMELSDGDTIETGPDGLAIIELGSYGVLKITENTILTLDRTGRDTHVNLLSGSLFTKVAKLTTDSFNVQTDSVVAGIRGTEFFMSYGQTIEEFPDIWLCVNEGTVEVGIEDTKDSVLVNEGEGITILSGKKLTDPKFYAWTEQLNWNSDPSSGSVENDLSLENAYNDLLDQDYF